jgi:hypothetical protein
MAISNKLLKINKMKKLALISAIAFSGLLYNTADAQFGIHVGIHLFPHRVINAPGPVLVSQAAADQDATASLYGNNDDFYYLPDVGAYYSVTEQLYYYFDGQEWIAAAYLPGVYRDYDWRYARRFEIREASPYLHNDFYRNRYQGFDCDLAHNHDHFRAGLNYQGQRDAYNAPQHFDNRGFDQRFDNNRGAYDQHFDNRGGNDQRFVDKGQFDNRNQGGIDRKEDNNRGGQQFDQNRNKDNNDGRQANNDRGKDKRDKQDRLAQNDKGYDGHKDGKRDRF